MLFVMFAKDRPGSGEKRAATRPVHIDHLNALGEKLVMAGALLDADGKPEGSVLVYEADTIEAATASLTADPFVEQDIFESIEIKPWRIAINHSGREY